MSDYRMGIKLTARQAMPAALKLLRAYFPEQSLAALKQRIETGEYLYLTDAEKYAADGRRVLARLMEDLDRLGLPSELYEEHRRGSIWEASPITRDYLRNAIRRSQIIARQVEEDIERETEE